MRKYKVYSLVCPKTKKTRYVGITYRPLEHRFKEHARKSKGSSNTNSKKIEWIKSLANEGLIPVVKLIKDNCNLEEALKIEENLINKHKNNLFNNQSRGSINNFKAQSNARKIHKCLPTGEIVATYSSTTEASAANNTDRKNISRCLSGKRKTYAGFIWKYAEGKKLSHRTILKDKKRLVGQYEDGSCVAIYKNTKEASKQTKLNEKQIINCCNKKKKFFANYSWQYVDTL